VEAASVAQGVGSLIAICVQSADRSCLLLPLSCARWAHCGTVPFVGIGEVHV